MLTDALLDAAGDHILAYRPESLRTTGSSSVQPQPSHRFGVRDALAAVVLEPITGFGGGELTLFRFQLVGGRCIPQSGPSRVDDSPPETARRSPGLAK